MNPEPTKHFRSLPFLVITFIILFAFSVWYYLYQLPQREYLVSNEVVSVATSTDEIADWKTYKNEKYGFEFKYPANSTIETSSSMDQYNQIPLMLEVRSSKNKFWVIINDKRVPGYIYETDNTLQVNVDNQNTKAYIFPNGYECGMEAYGTDDCSSVYVPIVKKGTNYIVQFHEKDVNQFVKEILATFKFTN